MPIFQSNSLLLKLLRLYGMTKIILLFHTNSIYYIAGNTGIPHVQYILQKHEVTFSINNVK